MTTHGVLIPSGRTATADPVARRIGQAPPCHRNGTAFGGRAKRLAAVVSFCLCILAVTLLFVASSPARAAEGFGIERFEAPLTQGDGSPATQAGSHPYVLTTRLYMKTQAGPTGGVEPDESLKDLHVNLPVGLIGNPTAVPRCTREEFEGGVGGVAVCPDNTQVGVLNVQVAGLPTEVLPIYNLVPSPGVPAELGGNFLKLTLLLKASVRTGGDYGVTVSSENTLQAGIIAARLVIWGVPADPSHDSQRCEFGLGSSALEAEAVCAGAPGTEFGPNRFTDTPRPFLTLPTACGGPLSFTETADSWQGAGPLEGPPFPALGEPRSLVQGCEDLTFTPTIDVKPETEVADSPTGLTVDLKVPQSEAVEGIAEAELKEAVVTLPAGMTVNPSAANGLGACSEAQIGLASAEKPACPPESKLATVKIVTPLLEAPLEGSVYVAQQGDLPGNGSNPFGSLFALYLVAEGAGVLVKLPGEITLDQSTGQLTARFGEDPNTHQFLPQLPFSELQMKFFGGPGAALVTPSACGSYTTTTELTPWSAPFSGPPSTPQSPFSISSGCTSGFSPSLSAGTTSNLAGSFSPLTVSFSRQDGEQELHAVQVQLPPGLLGEVANVPRCGEAQAEAGSCPQASEIGTVSVAAGAGPDPFWITGGHAFLTGSYAAQPFGLSIVVPAVAGPFNLGTEGRPVVVRAAISVNPQTAAVTITSAPFPTILQGVPLQIRTVVVNANRPDFTLNPTSCAPMSITGTLQGTHGAAAGLSAPYQAAGCDNLPFKPSFTVSTQGAASRATGASLTVSVAQKPGEANIHRVDVQLPLQFPSRLTTLQKACTEAQFAANPAGCPEGSFVGYATAHTPILSNPLSGPAILVSHGGAAFPDLVVILQGEGVTIDLTGHTDIKKGITYSRFETVPDAPISSFALKLPEGPHSVLAAYLPAKANYSFCGQSLTMPTTIVGQNGAQVTQSTKIAVTGCDPKPLTRAQELATALKACKKEPKRERASCESQARKRYGTKAKKASGRRKG